MAITQAMCTSFKVNLFNGVHNFTTNPSTTFKVALYTNSASLGAGTGAYTTSNEVSGTGYTAGGIYLTVNVTPTSSGTTAYVSFATATWSAASFTAAGAIIYNASTTPNNYSVAVLDFGGDKTVSGGDFNLVFPTAGPTTAILRLE
jgi:hypothetical protein